MSLLFGKGKPAMCSSGKVLPPQAVCSSKKHLMGASVPLNPSPGTFNVNILDLYRDINAFEIVTGFHEDHHPT